MARDRLRKLLLGGSLAVLGAWVVLPRVWSGLGPAEAQAAPPEEMTNESVTGAAAPADPAPTYAAELDAWATAPWPDDPFRLPPALVEGEQPKPDAPSSAGRPVLSAILSGAAAQALIDGQVLKVGDRLADGSVIAAIENSRVTLQGPQGRWTLELSE
jgi:hypothetical protein